MQRSGGVEEELLAISPPPEFQDLPAPPPAVFRDLSPSARGNNLTVTGQRACLKIQEVWDFASRISFDILNEAMIIAKEEVVSSSQHGGCHRTAPGSHQFPDSDIPLSSDSSEDEASNPLSTTTSWEYLSKASSWSDLRDKRQRPTQPQQLRVHTSPRHNVNQIPKSRKAISVSANNSRLPVSSSSNCNSNPVSFHNEICTTHQNHSASHQSSAITRSTSFHLQTNQQHSSAANRTTESDTISEFQISQRCTKRNSRGSAIGKSLDGTEAPRDSIENDSLCYNVPFQCDIYSFPIDSVPPDVTDSDSQSRPVAAPRRSHSSQSRPCRSSENTSRGEQGRSSENGPRRNILQMQISKHNDEESTKPNCNNRQKKSGEPTISLDTTSSTRRHTDRNVDSTIEIGLGNHENDNLRRNGIEIETRKQARRSRSVDMKMSSVGSYQSDASRSHIPKENRGPGMGEAGNKSTKSEKKNLGHSILNLFKRKPRSNSDNLSASVTSFHNSEVDSESENKDPSTSMTSASSSTISRALPLLPPATAELEECEPTVQIATSFPAHMEELPWPDDGEVAPHSPIEVKDFAASIEKVKDCGWYWGPLSSEAAEDLLRGEPDGSFIVRDSSDAHYIFSLTFKLNGLVRHVRIEHDQGNFSFGPLTRFKASTIVDFVEKAVAHSRSGRYLFFLHRRPVLGPMRVQLLHPYSRYRHPRSLQHMCRFVILKYVRRDLIGTLPLPKPLQEYLNTPHYYFEKHDEKKIACS